MAEELGNHPTQSSEEKWGVEVEEEKTEAHSNFGHQDSGTFTGKNLHSYSDASTSDGGLGDTSSSDLDQELLDQQPLNFCERIPLYLKLIIIASVSLVGVLIVSVWLLVIVGNNLSLSVRSNYLAYMVEESEKMTSLVEIEMNRSFRFDVFDTDGSRLLSSWSDTDVGLVRFSENVMSAARNHGTRASREAVEVAQEHIDRLPSIRDRVSSEQIPVEEMAQFYTRLYLSLMDVSMQMFTSQDIKQSVVQQNILSRIKSREFALMIVLGSVKLSNQTFSEELFERFVAYTHQRDTNVNLLKAFGHTLLVAAYEERVENTPEHEFLTEVERYVFENRYSEFFNVDGDQYYAKGTLRINKIKELMKAASEWVGTESNYLVVESVVEIIFVIAVSIIFFSLTLLISLIMSRTIVGPWRRMLKLQEVTIQRFVPSQFLALMKCKRIRELTRGKTVQRDLTVLCCSISNFSQVFKDCQSKGGKAVSGEPLNYNIVTFLNQYLEYVSELIVYYNGYIDSYERDMLIACFKSPSNAINCGMNYLKAVDTFNKIHHMHYPTVKVNIGIHQIQRVLIAAVGESERIHGTFLHEDFEIAKKLKSLAFQHDARIMVTSKTLSQVNKNTKKIVRSRLICKLISNSEECMDCFEIFNADSIGDATKIKSAKMVSHAVELMYQGTYLQSLVKLQSSSKLSDDCDPLIIHFIKVCEDLLNQTRKRMNRTTLKETLRDKILMDAFCSYCNYEHSQENIDLWNAIENFKAVADVDERKAIIEKIQNDYLNSNAKYCVNLSNEVKEACTKHLDEVMTNGMCSTCSSPCTIMTGSILDDVQGSIEFVMSDTFRRFQKSEPFKTAFMKCRLISSPSHLFYRMKTEKVYDTVCN